MSLQVEKLEEETWRSPRQSRLPQKFEVAVEKAYQKAKKKYLSSRIPQGQKLSAKNDRENVWYRCFYECDKRADPGCIQQSTERV